MTNVDGTMTHAPVELAQLGGNPSQAMGHTTDSGTHMSHHRDVMCKVIGQMSNHGG